MQIALDEIGNRVLADDAEKGNQYFCPVCRREVNICQGRIKIPYFAHRANDSCADSWNYDMSEWHRSMQERFPANQREVVVTHAGTCHRADVLCGNKVIDFQHSPISFDEIRERNDFYIAAGYSVAWVFDLQEQYDSGRIAPCDRLSGLGYSWSYPKASLQCFTRPSKFGNKLILYFYWINSDGEEEFNRVIWSRHDGGIPNFKEFITSYFVIDYESLGSQLRVDDFFITEKDRLYIHLSKVKQKYTVKYCGVRGKRRVEYICPRSGKFGITQYSESGCSYCRYCAAILEIPNGFQSYCCFPNQVNEVDEVHPGYECSGVPTY